MSCPIPPNDTERIAALHSYQLLDTLPEPDYDDLVRLASHICGTPMALITLIDRDRQWFKARVGLDGTETAREDSFCAHAICEPDNDLFVVSDARNDPRFAQNPLVTGDPNVRFYAGAPLVTHDGWALGSLCVVDRKPRQLTAEQAAALRALRRHVLNAFELRRLAAEQQGIIRQLDDTRRHLEAARSTALAATQAKSQFLATMSHEIRTPLNAVIGMTTLLHATPLNAEQKDYTETIRNSGEMLLTLINDILDFSKIESGRLDLEQRPLDLAACIDGALDLVAGLAQQKNLRLTRPIDPAVPAAIVGDVVRLRQVLLNLLSNAVKFTPRGEITLTVGAQTQPDGRSLLHFAVRDTGIGIAPDRLHRLFQAYTQADESTTRQYGGTGLGLTISRRLVELMGGRMWVESAPGKGSTFHFEFSAAPAVVPVAIPEGQALSASFAQIHPARILVADDNPINRKVALRTLQNLGYEPVAVADGEAAVAHARTTGCDFILMDDEMPGLNGPAATAEIRRALPADRQPVIAALTAHALAGDRERFLQAGMDEYLTKPLRVEQLTAILSRLPELRARRANG